MVATRERGQSAAGAKCSSRVLVDSDEELLDLPLLSRGTDHPLVSSTVGAPAAGSTGGSLHEIHDDKRDDEAGDDDGLDIPLSGRLSKPTVEGEGCGFDSDEEAAQGSDMDLAIEAQSSTIQAPSHVYGDDPFFEISISLAQFFSFFGESLAERGFQVPIVEISTLLTVGFSEEKLVDFGVLHVIGSTLCKILQICDDGLWLDGLAVFSSLHGAQANNLQDPVFDLIALVQEAVAKESLTSQFQESRRFRCDLLSRLLSAASECDLLRDLHKGRLASLGELQARKNELQHLLAELHDTSESFFIQVLQFFLLLLNLDGQRLLRKGSFCLLVARP